MGNSSVNKFCQKYGLRISFWQFVGEVRSYGKYLSWLEQTIQNSKNFKIIKQK